MMIARNKIKEMVTVPRNRRAMVASEIVMFMQQVVPCILEASHDSIELLTDISPSSAEST